MRGFLTLLAGYAAVFFAIVFLFAAYAHNLEYSVIFGALAAVLGTLSWGLDKEGEL